MRNLFLLTFISLLFSCTAQKKVTVVKDKAGNLIGVINKEAFYQTPYSSWFAENYENYNPNKNIIASLQKELIGVSIKGFMGTWCGDSKRETPHLYKLLELTDYNLKKLELVAVNKSKKTPNNLQKGFNIIRVPTFIFYKDGKEIGRYVEYARESLEKDILKIVTGQDYKHSYIK